MKNHAVENTSAKETDHKEVSVIDPKSQAKPGKKFNKSALVFGLLYGISLILIVMVISEGFNA